MVTFKFLLVYEIQAWPIPTLPLAAPPHLYMTVKSLSLSVRKVFYEEIQYHLILDSPSS